MIQLEQKNGKAKRGRPPKSKTAENGAQDSQGSVAQVKEPDMGKGPWVFKSKYREDRVTLKKPRKVKYDDGSVFVDAGEYAEFHRNTWTTDDAVKARKLREMIEERKDKDPLHIVETTVN